MVPQGRLQWYPYFGPPFGSLYEVSRHLWDTGTMQVIPVSLLRGHPLVSKSGLLCVVFLASALKRAVAIHLCSVTQQPTGKLGPDPDPASNTDGLWGPVYWPLKRGQEGKHFTPQSKHLSSFLRMSTQRERSTSIWDPRRHQQYMKTLPRKERPTS